MATMHSDLKMTLTLGVRLYVALIVTVLVVNIVAAAVAGFYQGRIYELNRCAVRVLP